MPAPRRAALHHHHDPAAAQTLPPGSHPALNWRLIPIARSDAAPSLVQRRHWHLRTRVSRHAVRTVPTLRSQLWRQAVEMRRRSNAVQVRCGTRRTGCMGIRPPRQLFPAPMPTSRLDPAAGACRPHLLQQSLQHLVQVPVPKDTCRFSRYHRARTRCSPMTGPCGQSPKPRSLRQRRCNAHRRL